MPCTHTWDVDPHHGQPQPLGHLGGAAWAGRMRVAQQGRAGQAGQHGIPEFHSTYRQLTNSGSPGSCSSGRPCTPLHGHASKGQLLSQCGRGMPAVEAGSIPGRCSSGPPSTHPPPSLLTTPQHPPTSMYTRDRVMGMPVRRSSTTLMQLLSVGTGTRGRHGCGRGGDEGTGNQQCASRQEASALQGDTLSSCTAGVMRVRCGCFRGWLEHGP